MKHFGSTYISTAILVVMMGCTSAAAWEPPVDPTPHAILNEAEEDTRAGRYEDALAKARLRMY